MKFQDYLVKSMGTEPSQGKYLDTIERWVKLVEISHHAIGFSTEVGEWVESRRKPEFEHHAHEEIGDMWWYVAGLIRWCFFDGELDGDSSFSLNHNAESKPEPEQVVIIASKILDQIKRGLFYGEIDMDKMRDYTRIAAQLLADLGNAPECWRANIAKLSARYPDRFVTSSALSRDIPGEREALSGGKQD